MYQFFASPDCHVDIFECTINIFEHLGWPKCAVYMGPLILANIKQSPTILENKLPYNVLQNEHDWNTV